MGLPPKLKTIPGLGDIAVQIVLAELPDLEQFENARQLAAWAGLTPQHHTSGTSGKTRTPITKIGSVHLRRGLFMPAMTARVFNPLLKTFADRLLENGKKPKQIVSAQQGTSCIFARGLAALASMRSGYR